MAAVRKTTVEPEHDWVWDGDSGPPSSTSQLDYSTASELALATGRIVLAVLPIGTLIALASGVKTHDTGLVWVAGPILVALLALNLQVRIARVLRATPGELTARVSFRKLTLKAGDVTWVARGASWSEKSEVGLVVGLRHRFMGAKWLYVLSDRDGRVLGFLRKSGAQMVGEHR